MKVLKVLRREKVNIKQLFDKLNIGFIDDEKNDVIIQNEYNIKVLTTMGYKQIEAMRLVKPEIPVTLYLKNKKTLKASKEHFVKTLNRSWVKIKDLINNDQIETKDGFSAFEKIKEHKKREELYDFQVKEIHSYFTNDINSHNSHTLVSIGCNAARIGKNVLYISLELYSNVVETRFDSNFTNIENDKIRFHKEVVKKRLESLKKEGKFGDIFVKYFPTGSVTVQQLKAYVNQLKAMGFNPDLILLDYADIIKPGRFYKDAHRLEQKGIYEDLRGWAGEIEKPIWTASQAGKQVIEKDWIGIEDLSDSFGKAMVADLIFGLTRKMDQRIDNSGKLFVAKSRVGKDGFIFPITMDTALSLIEVHETDHDQTKEILSGTRKNESGRVSMSSHKKSKMIDDLRSEFGIS